MIPFSSSLVSSEARDASKGGVNDAVKLAVSNAMRLLVKRDGVTGYGNSSFSKQQLVNLRIVSISSSSASLMFCLVMFYFYLAMHPSRLKFRHTLILILVIYDWLKAIAIIVYPIITLHDDSSVTQGSTINFLGFFTAMSIEGGDLAILAFAVHTCLTIFNSKRSGGLYPWRYWYYASTVIIPCVLASLAFINGHGYVSLDVWCYLPQSPIWLRLGLSFGPRYFIMMTILVIYFTVYFYVQSQLKKMDKQRKTIDYESTNKKRKWWSFSRYFEKEIMANEPVIINQKTEEALTSQDIINNLDINIQLQQANSQRLKTRYRVISRQMNLIFLYPTAYFFIWIFPVIGNSFRISYIQVYAISAIVAWVNPFNGVVDTLVFMIREKPWRYTYSKLARTQLDQVELVPCWRYWVRWLPLYRLPKELVEHYETVNHLREERSREPDFQFDTFADNISEFLSYPERSLNKDTKTSFQLSVVDNIESSCSTSDNTPNSLTKLQNNDTTNDKNNENDDDDSMDFLDFLNQGPPGV